MTFEEYLSRIAACSTQGEVVATRMLFEADYFAGLLTWQEYADLLTASNARYKQLGGQSFALPLFLGVGLLVALLVGTRQS
ncbi:MAG: hypothetical protein ABIH46_12870 [Chloroflexota bacterium]